MTRIKDQIRLAQDGTETKAKEKPWLYTEEELLYMKRQLVLSKRALERKRAERSKGFKNAS